MLWLILLLLLVVLAFGGTGYGYYRGESYAGPLGIVGVLLLVGLILWLIFGGGIVLTPPPTAVP